MTEIIHWVDVLSKKIIKNYKNINISTGITPSGDIHLGNLREILTADFLYRSISNITNDTLFYYFADTFDPLRKVYPFLDENIYKKYIGHPISDIPCPCGKHKCYSDHFLDPFLSSINKLNIYPKVIKTDELYKNGFFNNLIIQSLENKDKIKEIIEHITKKKIVNEWSPFNPLCKKCGRINKSIVTGYNREDMTIDYICDCGYSGTNNISGGGKLTWRVEWPAKWKLFNISVEPFGKDHASSGGSYETGIHISKDIFHHEQPFPIKYEWILLEDKGAMSSSSGVVISIKDMLKIVPPETLRYLIARTKPEKHIRFDPGLPILNLIDEYETIKNNDNKTIYDNYIINLCKVDNNEKFNLKIPYKQILTIYQITDGNIELIDNIFKKLNINITRKELQNIIYYIKNWIETYAPKSIRFGIQKNYPNITLTYYQKVFLKILSNHICKNELEKPSQIKEFITNINNENTDIYQEMQEEIKKYTTKNNIVRNKELEIQKYIYESIYLILLGEKKGPKVDWFLVSMNKDFLVDRINKAYKS